MSKEVKNKEVENIALKDLNKRLAKKVEKLEEEKEICLKIMMDYEEQLGIKHKDASAEEQEVRAEDIKAEDIRTEEAKKESRDYEQRGKNVTVNIFVEKVFM